MKIQDIIEKFEEDYSSFKLCNQVSKPELDKLKQFIQDNLTLMLEDIKAEVDEFPYNNQGINCGLEDNGITDRYSSAEYGHKECRQEVINIINSHK